MDIFECERKAQELGFSSATFKANFPAGVYECQWIDAYMGLLKVDADGLRDGFVRTCDISQLFPSLECFDFKA